jgi:hypothetical protein
MRPDAALQLAFAPEPVDTTSDRKADTVEEEAAWECYDAEEIAVECSTSPDDNPLYEAGAVLDLVIDYVGPGTCYTVTPRGAPMLPSNSREYTF